MLFRSSTFVNVMVQDIDLGTDPRKVSSVYCSQAAVLMLRECLNSSGSLQNLVGELKDTNSRLVSPHRLCSIFRRYAKPISNESLFSLHGPFSIAEEDDELDGCEQK